MNAPDATATKAFPTRSRPHGPDSRGSRVGLLLPWLLAPAWMFLPLGGCGLAKLLLGPSAADARPIGRTAAAAPEAAVPVGSTMTVLAAQNQGG